MRLLFFKETGLFGYGLNLLFELISPAVCELFLMVRSQHFIRFLAAIVLAVCTPFLEEALCGAERPPD